MAEVAPKLASKPVRFEGGEDLRKQLLQLGEKAGGILERAALQAIEPVRERAVTLAPVVTGRLRRSIKTRVIESNPHYVDVRIQGTYEKGDADYAPYAHLVESKKPFLRPAWDGITEDAMVDVFIDELNRVIDSIAEGP